MSQESEQIHEKCGVFAYSGDRFDAASLAFFGLHALQHRGQESAGIATFNDKKCFVNKGMGTVRDVFTSEKIAHLKGNIAVGHTRYSTNGRSVIKHAQPVVYPGIGDDMIALAHNGNIHDLAPLRLSFENTSYCIDGLNDSELITARISYLMHVKGAKLEDAVFETYPLLKSGAFAIALATANKVVAFRDGHGIRPQSLGRLDDGVIVASESCAINAISGSLIRDVQPGEMVVIENGEISQYYLGNDPPNLPTLCLFEYLYFMRPDSIIRGRLAYAIRRELGEAVAKESTTTDSDLVVAVPDSAIPSAVGFAKASGIPYAEGAIVKTTDIRSFIQPDQQSRELVANGKFKARPEILRGKSIIIVDDTMVRGTTLIPLIQLIRMAGAVEVHVRIPSSPIRKRDIFGINIPTEMELIANRYPIDQISEVIGADSLNYLSREMMVKVIGEDFVTDHIVTGNYPN